MRAESPGPSVGKLKPKVRQTARILYLICLGMTVLEVALLLAGGMPLFDALCTSFGSAGTGGGIKVSRIGILCKTMFKELGSYVLPKRVRKVEMDGKPLPHEVVRGVNVFLVSYLLVFTLSVLLVSLDGTDMVTNFTAVAATFNNIGPGLELVGPTGNFAHFSPFAKLVLSFDMLAGRLELFPVLLLFYPGTWKGALRRARRSAAA